MLLLNFPPFFVVAAFILFWCFLYCFCYFFSFFSSVLTFCCFFKSFSDAFIILFLLLFILFSAAHIRFSAPCLHCQIVWCILNCHIFSSISDRTWVASTVLKTTVSSAWARSSSHPGTPSTQTLGTLTFLSKNKAWFMLSFFLWKNKVWLQFPFVFLESGLIWITFTHESKVQHTFVNSKLHTAKKELQTFSPFLNFWSSKIYQNCRKVYWFGNIFHYLAWAKRKEKL